MLSNHPSVLGSGGGTAYNTIGGIGLFADGTAAAPSISFAADTDTGFYRSSSGNVRFSSNGVDALQMSSTGTTFIPGGINAGYISNVGAGGGLALFALGTNQNITLTPSGTGQTTLVSGNLVLSAVAGIGIGGTTYANGDFQIGYNGLGLYINTLAASRFISFNVNSVEKARFTATDGRFLLGTTTDYGALLQLGGAGTTTAATNGIVFSTDTSIHRNSAGLLRFGGTQTTAALNMGTAGYVSLANVSGGSCEVRLLSAGSIDLVSNGTTALTLDTSQRTILSGALRLANAYVAGAVVGTGYVTIQDSTGTTYRVPVLV